MKPARSKTRRAVGQRTEMDKGCSAAELKVRAEPHLKQDCPNSLIFQELTAPGTFIISSHSEGYADDSSLIQNPNRQLRVATQINSMISLYKL
jgi:hypothetical protein